MAQKDPIMWRSPAIFGKLMCKIIDPKAEGLEEYTLIPKSVVSNLTIATVCEAEVKEANEKAARTVKRASHWVWLGAVKLTW